jgi:hypothetical protein
MGSWRNGPIVPIRGLKRKRWVALILVLAWMCGPAGCSQDTTRLSPELERRFAAEGILRRADNAVFRYTHGQGTREAGWEDRVASILVTRQTVYLHKNEKVGLEITPRTRRSCEVERRADRVRIRAGTGRSAEVWSFQPAEDAEGWTRDIRAVIRATK